jgi:uncharacterized protein GlcG (DUF336 family)
MQLMQKHCLTLATAKAIAARAEQEAIGNAWPVVIAIVDDGGHLLYLARLDDTQVGSVEVAIQKARCALAFKRPTKVWEEAVSSGRTAVVALPGVIPIEGGVPLIHEGRVIGAIGVSGVRSAQDGQVAQAGAQVLA